MEKSDWSELEDFNSVFPYATDIQKSWIAIYGSSLAHKKVDEFKERLLKEVGDLEVLAVHNLVYAKNGDVAELIAKQDVRERIEKL